MRVPGRQRIRRLAHRLRQRFAVRGLILMYHRVAAVHSDPWGLAVSPAHFEEHLKILRSSTATIPLFELVGTLGTRRLSRRPIVVTFDDGYADNITAALPLLEQHQVPATVFLATGAIGSAREFWWDELERILLEPRDLPRTIDLRGGGWGYQRDLGADATYGARAAAGHRLWRTGQAPPTARHAMYYDLWQQL